MRYNTPLNAKQWLYYSNHEDAQLYRSMKTVETASDPMRLNRNVAKEERSNETEVDRYQS